MQSPAEFIYLPDELNKSEAYDLTPAASFSPANPPVYSALNYLQCKKALTETMKAQGNQFKKKEYWQYAEKLQVIYCATGQFTVHEKINRALTVYNASVSCIETMQKYD